MLLLLVLENKNFENIFENKKKKIRNFFFDHLIRIDNMIDIFDYLYNCCTDFIVIFWNCHNIFDFFCCCNMKFCIWSDFDFFMTFSSAFFDYVLSDTFTCIEFLKKIFDCNNVDKFMKISSQFDLNVIINDI